MRQGQQSRLIIYIVVLLAATGVGAQAAPDLAVKPESGASSAAWATSVAGVAKKPALAVRDSARAEAAEARMGGFLHALLKRKQQQAAASERQGVQKVAPLTAGNPFVRLRTGEQVQVNLVTDLLEAPLLEQIAQAGVEIEIANIELQRVQGWVALDRLEQLARLPGIRRVEAPHYAFVRRGSVTSEGDAILLANKLRAQGLTGKGARVGIISNGANDWKTARNSGDLPASGLTRYGSCSKRQADPTQCIQPDTCNEGTAMAEIIYDLAPDAKLAVASASTALEFIQRARQLVNDFRANIIVDDLGFYLQPYFEDGDIAQAVAALPGNVLFVSAAGNSGDGHYEREYSGGLAPSLHDFGWAEYKGSDTEMGVLTPARDGTVIIMQWNDPYENSSNDYDLSLFDTSGNKLAWSEENQSGAGSNPVEGFCYFNPAYSDEVRLLMVRLYSGAGKRLEIFTLGRGIQEYSQAAGSIFGHPGVPSVLTVGAINASDSGHNDIAYYSSRGPARIDFPAIVYRKKPDLIGIDGVRVSGAGGFSSPFYGTSAAAPHVAAVAALLKSKSPLVQAIDIRNALINGAVDLGSSGFDSTYGYGRVDALRALGMLHYGGVIVPPVQFLLN